MAELIEDPHSATKPRQRRARGAAQAEAVPAPASKDQPPKATRKRAKPAVSKAKAPAPETVVAAAPAEARPKRAKRATAKATPAKTAAPANGTPPEEAAKHDAKPPARKRAKGLATSEGGQQQPAKGPAAKAGKGPKSVPKPAAPASPSRATRVRKAKKRLVDPADPFGLIRARQASQPAPETTPAPVEPVPQGPLFDHADAVWARPLDLLGLARTEIILGRGSSPGAGPIRLTLDSFPDTPEYMDQVLDAMFEPEAVETADNSPIDRAKLLQLNRLADPTIPDDGWSLEEPFGEEEIVYLHWRLLRSIAGLADPRTSLLEKLSVLCWVFVDDPEADAKPFSFVQCLKVVGCSPLTNVRGLAYVGLVDPEEVRELVQQRLRRWMVAAFDHYPLWLREDIARRPDHYTRKLEKDPQWIAKKLRELDEKKQSAQASLFADRPGECRAT